MDRAAAVLGAGAVGAYLGGLLSAAGTPVTLIGRPRVVDPIAVNGLRIETKAGDVIEVHPDTRHAVADGDEGRFDLALLTVKAYDVESAIPDLRRLLKSDGLVLAFQNGFGSDAVVLRAIEDRQLVAATLTVSVGFKAPGTVVEFNAGGGIAVAPLDGMNLPEWLVPLLSTTGLQTAVLTDAASLRWSKLLLNMLGSAQSAILDVDLEAIACDARLFRVERGAFLEAVRVMRAAGIALSNLPGYPVRKAALAMSLPLSLAQRVLGPRLARGRGGKSPTMRSDLARNRGLTEVDYLNGAVAGLGATVGVQTPINSGLTDIVNRLARRPTERPAFRGNIEELLGSLRRLGANV